MNQCQGLIRSFRLDDVQDIRGVNGLTTANRNKDKFKKAFEMVIV